MSSSRTIVSFINVAHVIDHMFMLILPTAVLGMEAEFGRPYGELLALSIGGFIAFGAGSIPSGWLGDLWSRRNMMAVFFIGIGLATAATGFATTPAGLAVGLTLVGLFASIYHPVGTAMLVAHSEKVGRAIGINGVWGNLGVAGAALVTGALTQHFGWRAAFILPGAIAVAAGIAFLAMVPDIRAPKKGLDRKTADLPRRTIVQAFAVLAAVTVAGGLVFNATTVSMPKLFDERLAGLAATPSGVGALAAAVYVIGATAQIVVGRLVDRYPLRAVFVPLAALQAPALFIAGYVADGALLVVAAVMMFAIFGQVTINDTFVARYTTDEWRARVYAVRYLVSFTASASAVPLVAFLHDGAGGFTSVYVVLAAFGLLVFAGALLTPRHPAEAAAMAPRAA
ncbi:MAG TPA: MFS transporter [Alphaproteobacteria bacterium]